MSNFSPQFGLFVVPYADNINKTIELVQSAESLGYEFIGIQDHPYQKRFLETFSLISFLVAKTDRLKFVTDVANLPLRGPSMLAKAAASLNVLGNGRFDLGFGAGGFWDAIEAFGGPRRTPGEAVRATEEAIDIMRLFWSEKEVISYDGEFYKVSELKPGPKSKVSPRIVIGAYGPKMIDLIGRKADGWLPSFPSLSTEKLSKMNAVLEEAIDTAGRKNTDVKKYTNYGDFNGQQELNYEKMIADLAVLIDDFGFETVMINLSLHQLPEFKDKVISQFR